jgi:hypothetical protein
MIIFGIQYSLQCLVIRAATFDLLHSPIKLKEEIFVFACSYIVGTRILASAAPLV